MISRKQERIILRLISAYLKENREEADRDMRQTGSFSYFITLEFFSG